VKIIKIAGRQIYDSRGEPTLACDIWLENGVVVTGVAPSGSSKGSYEAFELRDGGDRFGGRGVFHSIEIIKNVIEPVFLGLEPHAVRMDLEMINLDGTHNKSKFGANTLIAVSMALYRAHAAMYEVELYELIARVCEHDTVTIPSALMNFINGGVHAENNLSVQEYHIIPSGMIDFKQAMGVSSMIFQELKMILHNAGKSTLVGDEGGFAPSFDYEAEPFEYLMKAIERVELPQGSSVWLGLDVAATQLYNATDSTYRMGTDSVQAQELIDWYKELTENYPLYLIEDGLAENDWQGWTSMFQQLGHKVNIIGDDVFATNLERIAEGIEHNAVSGAIIKPNQIGTITETLQAIKLCQEYDLKTILSHRSGETEDTFIVDLAVGSQVTHLKAGGCSRSERLAKYNRLLAIEAWLVDHNK
jgi:enolase